MLSHPAEAQEGRASLGDRVDGAVIAATSRLWNYRSLTSGPRVTIESMRLWRCRSRALPVPPTLALRAGRLAGRSMKERLFPRAEQLTSWASQFRARQLDDRMDAPRTELERYLPE